MGWAARANKISTQGKGELGERGALMARIERFYDGCSTRDEFEAWMEAAGVDLGERSFLEQRAPARLQCPNDREFDPVQGVYVPKGQRLVS